LLNSWNVHKSIKQVCVGYASYLIIRKWQENLKHVAQTFESFQPHSSLSSLTKTFYISTFQYFKENSTVSRGNRSVIYRGLMSRSLIAREIGSSKK
jgi:hypothetical protein